MYTNFSHSSFEALQTVYSKEQKQTLQLLEHWKQLCQIEMILSLSCYSFTTWFSEAISIFVISPKERYCSLFHVAYYRDKLFWFVAHCLLSGGRLKEEDCVTRQKRAKQNCKSSETNHTKDIAYLKWDQTGQMYQIYKRTLFCETNPKLYVLWVTFGIENRIV